MSKKLDAMNGEPKEAKRLDARLLLERVEKLDRALRRTDNFTYMTLEDCSRGLDVFVADPKNPNHWIFKVAQECVEAIRSFVLVRERLTQGEKKDV